MRALSGRWIRTRKTCFACFRFFYRRTRNTRRCVQIQRRPPTQFIKEAFFSGSQGKNQNSHQGVRSSAERNQSAEKIVETARRTGARVSGPVPLPTEKEVVTILRAVHKYKDSREQFEMRTHKRLIDILRPSNKTVEALMGLELPAGVEIEIKL